VESDISDSEFSVPGFTMFRSDREVDHREGGVLIYVRSDINPVETNMKSNTADQVWCKVKIMNGEDLLIGVCYRSSNEMLFGKDSDKLLCDLIREVRSQPLLLMGYFNLPDIDWSLCLGTSTAGQNFVDCTEEAFLTQHVTQSTR